MLKILLLALCLLHFTIKAQSVNERLLIGEWACCGEINLESGKEIRLIKKTVVDMAANCNKPLCFASSIVFEHDSVSNSVIFKTDEGCYTEGLVFSHSKSSSVGGTWYITPNKKYVIFSIYLDRKIQTRYEIIKLTATELVFKRG